jgi:hypothetical protein
MARHGTAIQRTDKYLYVCLSDSLHGAEHCEKGFVAAWVYPPPTVKLDETTYSVSHSFIHPLPQPPVLPIVAPRPDVLSSMSYL